MWVPPEVKDPMLQHHPTRKSVGYFGAVRLRDGKFIFARELNRFDAVSTWNFLRLLRRRSLNSRRRVIVITDNAKYHHAKLHSAWRQEHQAHFALITSRHTVPISTQSNECGSLLESFASTTNISRLSQRLSRSSKPSSRNGQMAMSHLGAFVPSKYFAFIYVRVYRRPDAVRKEYPVLSSKKSSL